MPKKQRLERGEHMERVLFVCDQQVPYHDPRAVALVTDYARYETEEGRPFDLVVQGGDWADMTGLTKKFLLHPDNQNRLRLDFKIMRGQHEKLSDAVGWDVPQIWVEGNHEDRLTRYLLSGAPELAYLMVGDDEAEATLSIPRLTGFDRYDNIKYVAPYGEVYEHRYNKGKNKFLFKHGDKHGKYAAARELESNMENGMSGHNHRAQSIYNNTWDGPKAWWSMPALCNIKGADCPPGYMNGSGYRNWQQGFGEVWFSKERALFEVQTHIIHEGGMVANGRQFTDVRGK